MVYVPTEPTCSWTISIFASEKDSETVFMSLCSPWVISFSFSNDVLALFALKNSYLSSELDLERESVLPLPGQKNGDKMSWANQDSDQPSWFAKDCGVSHAKVLSVSKRGSSWVN